MAFRATLQSRFRFGRRRLKACSGRAVDIFSREKRSAIMAQVKSRNTSPEKTVRSLLHRLGFRFRLHRADLPGTPDITLPRYRAVIFVNGCFWHQHRGCSHAARPASNRRYWNDKLDRNVARDAMNIRLLRKLGWKVLVVWECQTTEKKLKPLATRLLKVFR